MKKTMLVLSLAMAAMAAQANGTLEKIKTSGSVTMGVRES